MIGRLIADQRIRYLVVGAWNTLFGYAFFALLLALLGHRVHYLALVVVAHVVAVAQNYVLYRTVVFRSRGGVLGESARFSAVYLVALGGNLAILPLLVEAVGMPILVAQGLVVSGTVIASYAANRRFTFRRDAMAPTSPQAMAPRLGRVPR